MITIDLNEITKDYNNTSDDCFLAKIAIKKAILEYVQEKYPNNKRKGGNLL